MCIRLSKNKQAVRSPVTLTIVLVISKILSTPSKSTTAIGGMPAAMRIVESITIPVPGAEGAPIDAAIAVKEINKIVVNPKSILKSCAKKNTAIIWYNAVPSMLIVAPKGMMNCETFGFTFIFSSAVLIESGITAAELEVENANN